MWDFISASMIQERSGFITKDEFASIMRGGDEGEKIEALARMELAGGYENLE